MSLKTPTVMLVDDEPHNLNVLEEMLRMENYHVVAFPRGDLALASAQRLNPDLILLDVCMPGLDGYEVCRRLKKSDALKEIPVIFLSGLMAPSDKVLAFEAGAVDYIVKPLSEPEVLARVRAHLTLRFQTIHLNELVRKRTAELAAAHQRLKIWDAAKTHWITMLTHELRTPLTGLFCVADMLFNEIPPERDVQSLRDDFNWSCARIKKLADDASLLATIEVASDHFELAEVDVVAALEDATQAVTLRSDNIRFIHEVPASRCTWYVHATASLLRRAFEDILFAAGCCTQQAGCVRISMKAKRRTITIQIASDGQNLSPEDRATFFDIGGQRTLCRGGADFGLGPALANKAIQLFDGETHIHTDAGTVIDIALPLCASHMPPEELQNKTT